MAAASAGLAVGIPDRIVARGLRSFVLDPERNPGRTNLFALDRRLVVIDYAHNEAGMIGLTQVLDALRRRGREVWIAICTAGDRTDEILHDFAFRAAVGADHLAVAELPRYLRGRPRAEIVQRLRAGALDAGVNDVPEFEDELHALRAMLKDSRPGDVVGVTALGMRHEVFAWLDEAGARRLGPSDVKRVVRAVARSKDA
jgi:cyanophycin synthetase